MDLKELVTFRAIIQEGTFSRAADKLNYAQSTVTHQVQRLEKELGITLFERGWEAELTPAGKIYAQQVDGLIAHWQFVLEQAKSLQKEEIGTLTIGVLETLTGSILPRVLQRFREQKPNIVCNFIVGNTDTLKMSLQSGAIDFAICAEPTTIGTLRFDPIYNEKISFVVAANHPLAGQRVLSLHDLSDYPLVMGGTNCIYRIKMEKEFSRIAAEPFFYTVSQLSSIPGFIQRIPAIGVIVESVRVNSDLVQLPLEISDPFIPVGILQDKKKEYMSATKELFIRFVREELERPQRQAI